MIRTVAVGIHWTSRSVPEWIAKRPRPISSTLHLKVKVKLSLCLTNLALRHEGVWRSGCIDPHFLDLGISWRWVVSFTPGRITPGERATGTHWIGGSVNPRAGLNDVRENSWPHRDSNYDPSVGQPVASRYTDWAIPALLPSICLVYSLEDLQERGRSTSMRPLHRLNKNEHIIGASDLSIWQCPSFTSWRICIKLDTGGLR
jgi:hypothetical protein